MPTITIIIVTYNAGFQLIDAIESIKQQNYKYLELIIIDGGSNDNTIDILKSYSTVINFWSSEKDKGIYEAMNKGIQKSTGEWIYFLGSDDRLCEGVLSNISPKLNSQFAAVFGYVIYDTGDIVKSSLNKRILFENTLHHQATFYNSDLFKKFRYDPKYKINSDYELNLKLYLNNSKVKSTDLIIAKCGSLGVSSVLQSREINSIRDNYIKDVFLRKSLSFALSFYYSYFNVKKTIKQALIKILRR